MSTDTDALVAFIRARLDEDEQWALAASTPRPHAESNPQVPAEGLHWQWGVGPNWAPVEIDPSVQEVVGEDGGSCVLISVEEWQTRTGMLPRRYGDVEELDAAAAGHIVRHDPARVLRDVEADRKLIKTYEEAHAYYDQHKAAPAGEVHGLLMALKIRAERFDDHKDYQESWRP